MKTERQNYIYFLMYALFWKNIVILRPQIERLAFAEMRCIRCSQSEIARWLDGDLAHLVERQVRNLKVAGSSPVISTG